MGKSPEWLLSVLTFIPLNRNIKKGNTSMNEVIHQRDKNRTMGRKDSTMLTLKIYTNKPMSALSSNL